MAKKRTTLGEHLNRVFAMLEKAIPNGPGPQMTILDAWAAVFGGSGHRHMKVVIRIHEISEAMAKFEEQIVASELLDHEEKNHGRSAVRSFDVFLDAKKFNHASQDFRASCSAGNRSLLSILGKSMSAEFSMPALEKVDAEEIAAALNEVKQLLNDSDIALELRSSLTKHLDAMLWWLQHPEIVHVQDLFESMGSAMVIAGQIRDRDPEGAGLEPTQSKEIFDKITDVGGKVSRILGMGARIVDGADKLFGAVQHALGGSASSS